MSITDELREWAEDNTLRDRELTTCPPQHVVRGVLETLLRIADRIDAEHQNAEDEWRTKNGDMWLKGYAACHEELMEGHPVIVADLENAGWVKLPVDSDGVPIRVGDKVQLIGNDPSTVSHMSLADDGWRVYVKYDGGIGTGSGEPKRIRHHHAPTVEDVLREFADDVRKERIELAAISDETIIEYAAKLRLAGDAE